MCLYLKYYQAIYLTYEALVLTAYEEKKASFQKIR